MNIQDIVKAFKTHQLQYGLDGDSQQDELYKWKLLTKQIGRPNTDAEDFKYEILSLDLNNLCYSTQVTAYRNFAKYEPEEYRSAMRSLLDESLDLQQRVDSFISTCKELWDSKIKDNFDNKTSAMCDERLISCFLTLKYPAKYTFYKSDVYVSLCKILGIETQKAGHKLVHFYDLLNKVVIPAIEQESELLDSVNAEVDKNGYIHSMPLIAQTALWYNLSHEKKENKSDKFRDNLCKEAERRGFEIDKKGSDFVWVGIKKDDTSPTRHIHYELSFDVRRPNTSSLGHDRTQCYAEIHLEEKTTNKMLGLQLLQGFSSEVQAIEWEKGVPNSGFRMINSGVPINAPDAVEKALDDLETLYSLTYEVVSNANRLLKQKQQKKAMLTKELDILTQKKQIVLQGAPGTGKTYKTAEIAVAVCDGAASVPSNRKDLMERYKQLVSEKRIVFTTFHQSMDYEEFVEGIKPYSDGGEISYNVEDGIFKTICKMASSTKSSNFDEAYKKFMVDISDLDDTNPLSLKTVTGKVYGVCPNSRGNLHLLTGPSLQKQGTLTKENLEATAKGVSMEGWQSYFQGVINYLEEKYALNIENEKQPKNYVLIIDEINRANISKVLGELITLLETDKRLGETNEVKVRLPYSKDEFGVPSNLYIIGTMNTADRSVGYIDYAIRRRFAFITIKADAGVVESFNTATNSLALEYFNKVKDWVSEKNVIGDIDADDLMVGHSYFLADSIQVLKTKMQYEVIPLLHEYIKDGILSADIREELKNWEKELG